MGEGGFNSKCGAEAARKCGVIVSEDLGKTWDTSRLHESLGFDSKNGILLGDMTVAEIGKFGLYAVFRPKGVIGEPLVVRRTAKTMRLYTAISTDVGKTWTRPREMSSEMRTFDAAARLFRLQPKGPLVLAYNDRSSFDNIEGEGNIGADGMNDHDNDNDNDENGHSSTSSSSSGTSFSDAATNLGVRDSDARHIPRPRSHLAQSRHRPRRCHHQRHH